MRRFEESRASDARERSRQWRRYTAKYREAHIVLASARLFIRAMRASNDERVSGEIRDSIRARVVAQDARSAKQGRSDPASLL
jgi:hypothetical protein